MTAYGRALSRELLSADGVEGEEQALYGVVKQPGWLQVGGDVRALQSYSNSVAVEQAKFTFMQADLELGVVSEQVQAVATVGYQNDMSAHFTGSPILSRRHYLKFLPTAGDSLLIGRFNVPFGIAWPDHFLFSKRDLGWDEGGEAYQVAWAHTGAAFETMLSLNLGRPDAPELMAETGAIARAVYSLSDKHQVGVSALYGTSDRRERWLLGPTAIFTPLKRFSVFLELNLQRSVLASSSTPAAIGGIETVRLNYEMWQGVHLSFIQELSQMDFATPARTKDAYTLGVQWFPRPHVEVTAGLRKQRSSSTVSFTDSGWVVLHYYL